MKLNASVYNAAQNYLRYFSKEARKQFWNKFGDFSRNNLIVLGNQKSGTTAIAALLAKAAGLDAALDLPPVWEPVLEKLHKRQVPLKTVAEAEKYLFSRQLIKEPNLTFFYGQVKEIYPQSKYIFIVRHPLQNIRSLLNRIGVRGDLAELDFGTAGLNPHELSLFSSDYYSFYSNNYIEMLALRWKFCANVYLQNKHNFVLVKYEDFLEDKKGYIEELALQLGYPIKAEISGLTEHQFQPKGNADFDLHSFFGSNYSTVKRICHEEMKLLGYE